MKINDRVSILSGRANPDLSKKIADKLNLKITKSENKNFSDGEIYVKISASLRCKDAYIIQPSAKSVNDSIMETLLMSDAAKRRGAKNVIAVVPYMGYERQDRRVEDGESVATKLHANLLKAAGVNKVMFLDLHANQIEGCFSNDIEVIHIKSLPLIADYLKKKHIHNMIIVSPDAGGAKRVELLAEELECPYAIIHKIRKVHNEAEAVRLIGDVSDKDCVLYDDMIDTAGTIAEAVKMLKSNGAKNIYVCAAHGIFSDSAFERLKNAGIKEVIITNSLPLKGDMPKNIIQLDISGLIADKIKEIYGCENL